MTVHIKNEKAVLKDTRTKKAIHAENSARRSMWAIRPTTRVKPSAKVYNRKKTRHEAGYDT